MIDFVASVFGIIGMYLLSLKNSENKRLLIFSCFMVSNIGLIVYSIMVVNIWLFFMYSIYAVITFKGIYQNFKNKRIGEKE